MLNFHMTVVAALSIERFRAHCAFVFRIHTGMGHQMDGQRAVSGEFLSTKLA